MIPKGVENVRSKVLNLKTIQRQGNNTHEIL